mgnify:CR=1 FL=1
MQEASGKPGIGVGTLIITSAPERRVPASEIPKAAETVASVNKNADQLAAEIAAKAKAQEAGKLLKEYHVEPRVVLRLLTDGGAVAGALEGQAQAEIEVLGNRNDLSPEQKQKLAGAINERYKRLIQYSENRGESTRKQIKKLEASSKPEDKALLLDITSAGAQIEQSTYQENVDQIDVIFKTQQLTPEVRAKYEKYQEELNEKIIKIEASVKDTKSKRDEIKSADDNTIPDIIKEMAVAISGGEVKAVEEEKNPVVYIQKAMTNALTTEGGLVKLADNLVKSSILNEADKAQFVKDMELGLTREDIAKMTKNIAGKTALGFVGLLSMLGYVALQRRLHENTAQ